MGASRGDIKQTIFDESADWDVYPKLTSPMVTRP